MKNRYIVNDTRKDSQHRRLLDLIPEGERNAIPIYELASRLNVGLLQLLRMIKYAQLDGNIIAVMDNGVFIPRSENELHSYINYEKAGLQFDVEALNIAISHMSGEGLVLVYKGVDYEE